MRVAIVLNAHAGTARYRMTPAQVDIVARRTLARLGADPVILPTGGPGHASDLARRALEDSADVVCAWGGDGTVNEVASGLVHRRGVLAVVPAGSGNGFARDLGIPLDMQRALAVAVAGAIRVVDVGEANGRLFVNTAGFGLDASVAHAFAIRPAGRRGLGAYVVAGLQHLAGFEGRRCTVCLDGVQVGPARLKVVTVANTRQWGGGALVAPDAKPDDGVLDLVQVRDRSTWGLAVHVWRLWTGSVGRIRGVSITPFHDAVVEADGEWPLHIDGDPAGHASRLEVRVKPKALSVRVPAR